MALEIHQKNGVLRIEVDAPDVLHVTYSPLDANMRRRRRRIMSSSRQDWPAASFEM